MEVKILVDYNNIDELRSSKDYKFHYFYRIDDKARDKYYYGIHSTSNIYDNYRGSGGALRRAYKKFGEEDFEMSILCFFETRKDLCLHEKQVVNTQLLEDSNCYNLILGGSHANYATNKVMVNDREGNRILVSSEEYAKNKEKYIFHTTGRVHINNGVKNKLVYPEELERYIKEGWVRGETQCTTRYKICISKDGIDKYVEKDQLFKHLREGWTRGGKSRNKGNISHAKEKYWVNNGEICKRVYREERDELIEKGWVKGSIQNHTKGYISLTDGKNSTRIDPEKSEVVRFYLESGWYEGFVRKSSKMVWIKKEDSSKLIKEEEIDKYLEEGWMKGRGGKIGIHTQGIKYKSIYKGNVVKKVNEEELPKYLEEGWKKGNPKCGGSKIGGRLKINKDGVNKTVTKEELDKYLAEGWVRGQFLSGDKNIKGRFRIIRGEEEKLVLPEEFNNKYIKEGWVRGCHARNTKKKEA